MTNSIQRHELTILKRLVDQAVSHGWSPRNTLPQGTDVLLDPPCVVLHFASPSQLVDNDIYLDWLSPLTEPSLVKAAWGRALVGIPITGCIESWKFHQEQLLHFLQDEYIPGYFEYIEATL